MKKLLFTCFSMFVAAGLMAQCSDLFISEYIEGSNNNKALEIYNPTANAINLSGYAIGRFSNGSTNPSSDPVVLPNVMLQPYDVYVIVLDRRQEDGTGFDLPSWNGYNVFDILTDEITNDTIIDFCRDEPRLFVQYIDDDSNNSYEYTTTYDPTYDLQGKADTFACPDYNTNNGMSYNGNDAVFLITGNSIASDGSNIVDVVGVIGENPENTIGQPAWTDAFGKWVTRDITITRRANVQQGSGVVAAVLSDTLAYNEWDYHCNNDFTNLGSHGCNCDPNFVGINEVVNEIPVNVQPNPASNWLLVNAPQAIQQIEVYDLTGKLVFQQNYDNFNTEIRLNVHDYQSGMYVVNVIFDDNQRTVEKFVVR